MKSTEKCSAKIIHNTVLSNYERNLERLNWKLGFKRGKNHRNKNMPLLRSFIGPHALKLIPSMLSKSCLFLVRITNKSSWKIFAQKTLVNRSIRFPFSDRIPKHSNSFLVGKLDIFTVSVWKRSPLLIETFLQISCSCSSFL